MVSDERKGNDKPGQLTEVGSSLAGSGLQDRAMFLQAKRSFPLRWFNNFPVRFSDWCRDQAVRTESKASQHH